MTWSLDPDSAVPLWRRQPADSEVMLAFSTRRGGVSGAPFDTLNLGRSTLDRPEAVKQNRHRFLEALDLDAAHIANAGQIHGAQVVEALEPGLRPDCDALVTRVPGLALAITTADCLPMLYATPGAVGAAHAGWRGTAAGIPVRTLRAVADLAGVAAARVDVHLGPCIRACCYDVGPEVAEQFPAPARKLVNGAWRLDLVAAVRLQLHDSGVAPERIHEVAACTACNPTWYFSHRRDQGKTGRMWAIAALPT